VGLISLKKLYRCIWLLQTSSSIYYISQKNWIRFNCILYLTIHKPFSSVIIFLRMDWIWIVLKRRNNFVLFLWTWIFISFLFYSQMVVDFVIRLKLILKLIERYEVLQPLVLWLSALVFISLYIVCGLHPVIFFAFHIFMYVIRVSCKHELLIQTQLLSTWL